MKHIFLSLFLACIIVPFTHAINTKVCTMEVNPVCGIHPTTGEHIEYGNRCMRDADGATPCNITSITTKKSSHVHQNIQKIVEEQQSECISSAGYAYNSVLHKCVRAYDLETIFEWAKKTELTTASTLEDFRGNDPISREEVATIITRAFEKTGIFPTRSITPKHYIPRDAQHIAPELYPAINFVYNAGIMRGNGEYFFPKHHITHLETIITLIRAMDKETDVSIKVHPWYKEYVREFEKRVPSVKGISQDTNIHKTYINRREVFYWIMQIMDTTPPKMFLDGSWILQTFQEKWKEAKNITAMVTLEKNSLHAQFCNTMNGEISYTDTTFSSKGLMSTKMLCESKDIMDAEMKFSLDNAKFILEKSNTQLTITTKNGDTYIFEKQ